MASDNAEGQMIRYEAAVNVSRSPDEVFDAVNDIGQWGSWTDMRDIRHEGTGPISVGSTGTFSLAKGPFKGPVRYVATAFDPGRRVEYRLSHPAFDWIAAMTVEPSGTGTRLGTSGTFQLRGLWRLLQPIVAGEVRRGEAAELERLKEILEAGHAAPSARSAADGTPRTAGGGA
jgi:hypothetical protein